MISAAESLFTIYDLVGGGGVVLALLPPDCGGVEFRTGTNRNVFHVVAKRVVDEQPI
jgi:hypothetical protein